MPYEHLNVSAFSDLASIVGYFTKHIASLDTLLDSSVDYEWLFRKIQSMPLTTNSGIQIKIMYFNIKKQIIFF